MKILHIGCGLKKFKTQSESDVVIGVDIAALPEVDMVCDLDKFPWCFRSDEFDMVIAEHIIEHLSNTAKVMEELWRITKNNAIIKIRVPYFTWPNAVGDPTHKSFFTLLSFEYFTSKSELNYYTKARFEILENRLNFKFKILGFGIINRILNFLFNGKKSKYFYELFLSRLIPAAELHVKLKTIK